MSHRSRVIFGFCVSVRKYAIDKDWWWFVFFKKSKSDVINFTFVKSNTTRVLKRD